MAGEVSEEREVTSANRKVARVSIRNGEERGGSSFNGPPIERRMTERFLSVLALMTSSAPA